MIQAVIFDLDGTLIDSERVYREYWTQACKDAGCVLTNEQFLQLRSLNHPDADRLMKSWFGPDFDYAAVQGACASMGKNHLKKYGFPKKDGVDTVLKGLKERNITAAIATSTDHDTAVFCLKQAGIDPAAFDHILSAAGIEHGKPAPDVYLFAAKALGLAPEACLAAEDSPNGLRSARGAGMFVVYVPDLSLPEKEDAPFYDVCAGSLSDLLPLIDRLNRSND